MILKNPSEVKAEVEFQGKTYKAKIRLKGDLPDHWESVHRMSLRIDLKGDATIFGLNEFNIQKPRTRLFPYDPVFQDLARSMGNLSVKHNLVKVKVNGQDWGFMDLESHVGKEFLERPALYNIGDRDYSGWYGSDYYNATIQAGSQKLIYEEVVMPRYENNVLSEFNKEEEYHYSSSLSASLHKPYSSSLVVTDLDNRWDESTGTERLFYLGCIQDDDSTEDKTPAVEVTFTTPTKITTGTNPNARLNVVNKGF